MQAEAGFAVLGAFFICALPVGALQSTMTEEEYGAAMTEINFIVGDAELHIDARYWPELFEDLGKLRTQFTQVEAFWTARGSDEAAAFAREVIEGLRPIGTAGDEKDTQAASRALREIRGTCESCHEAFREHGPDGYQIKQWLTGSQEVRDSFPRLFHKEKRPAGAYRPAGLSCRR